MNTPLLRVPAHVTSLALSALTLTLAACGGGGDSTTAAPAQQPTAPAPTTPVVTVPDDAALAAITTVAPPAYTGDYADMKLALFNHMNSVRASVGLGLFSQDSRLDTAAQAHSLTHFQQHNEPGFDATYDPWKRMTKAGYPWAGATEVMSFEFWKDGEGVIEAELNSVYHRMPVLAYRYTHVGIGQDFWQSSNMPFSSTTIDFGYTSTSKQAAPNTPYVVWPRDGVTVPQVHMVPEDPDPENRQNGQFSVPYGYPASVHVDEAKTLMVTKFEMRDASGALVAGTVSTVETDTHMAARSAKNWAVFVPSKWLPQDGTYTLTFEGSSSYRGAVTPIKVTWSFKTPSQGFTSNRCGTDLAVRLYSDDPGMVFDRSKQDLSWLPSYRQVCAAPENWLHAAHPSTSCC